MSKPNPSMRRMPLWWNDTNARRFDLIHKKSREGLSTIEDEEMGDLQDCAIGLVFYVNPSPPLLSPTLYLYLGEKAGVPYAPPVYPMPEDWLALNFKRAGLLRRKWLPGGLSNANQAELEWLNGLAEQEKRWYKETAAYHKAFFEACENAGDSNEDKV